MGKTVLFWLPLLFRQQVPRLSSLRSINSVNRMPSPFKSPATTALTTPRHSSSPSPDHPHFALMRSGLHHDSACSSPHPHPHRPRLALVRMVLVCKHKWECAVHSRSCLHASIVVALASLSHSLTLAVSSRCHLISRRRPPCVATAQCVQLHMSLLVSFSRHVLSSLPSPHPLPRSTTARLGRRDAATPLVAALTSHLVLHLVLRVVALAVLSCHHLTSCPCVATAQRA